MFARQAFRPARALQTNIRRYASDSAPKSGSNTTLLLGAAAVAAGGGYYWYLSSGESAQQAKEQAKKVIPTSEPPKTFTGGDQGFISLQLESAEPINHNVKKFRFKLPEEDAVSGLHVASALLTKYQGPKDEKPTIRPYTPVNDEDARGFVEFQIKRYPNGPMSEHLHAMEPGQRLDFKGPIPKYPWSPNKHEHIAMIAGGTGITPMWQLARAIFKNPDDQTKVTLVFGNIKEEDILLRKEWEELENTYPRRFRAFYTLDMPPQGWQHGKGYVTKELLKTVLPEPKEGEKIKIFVCGPPGMYKAISGTKKSPVDQGELDGFLKELGYAKDQVYKF